MTKRDHCQNFGICHPLLAIGLCVAGLFLVSWSAKADEPKIDPDQFKTTGDKVEVKTEHFIIEAYNQDLAKLTSELSEQYLDELSQAILGGAAFPHKITIRIYKTKKDFHEIGKNPVWAGGVARRDVKWGKPDRVELYQLDNANRFDPDMLTRTLPHELTHAVIADLSGVKGCPLWINEGLAQSFEKFSRPQTELRGLALAVEQGRYARFQDIMAIETYPQDIERFYLQSDSMARFLLSNLDPAQFSAFLKAAINKEPMDKALSSAFGIKKEDALDQIENRWARWIADNYGRGAGNQSPALDVAPLFAAFNQRESDLIAGTRTWKRQTFIGAAALPKDWKNKSGVLSPSKAQGDQPAALPLRDLPTGPYLVRFKVKRDESTTVPVRFYVPLGDGPATEVGVDLTDDNWHDIVLVSADQLSCYSDGQCTGRAMLPTVNKPAVPEIRLYGAASIKDVDVANAALPK